jgi:dihydroxy-acid dehydratase
VIDVAARTIDLDVPGDELVRRQGELKHPEPRYTSGVLAKYAKLAQGAEKGAITE